MTLKDHFVVDDNDITLSKTQLYITQLKTDESSVTYKVEILVGASFAIKSELLVFKVPIIQEHRITFEMPENMTVVDIRPIDDNDTKVYFSSEPRPCNASQLVQIDYQSIGKNSHSLNITLAKVCGVDSINDSVTTISYTVQCVETLWTSVN